MINHPQTQISHSLYLPILSQRKLFSRWGPRLMEPPPPGTSLVTLKEGNLADSAWVLEGFCLGEILPLTFHQPKRVNMPCLTSREQGSTNLPHARKGKNCTCWCPVMGIKNLNFWSWVSSANLSKSFPHSEPQLSLSVKRDAKGFPSGAVVENLPANAGDTGSSPGPVRSHMPRSN